MWRIKRERIHSRRSSVRDISNLLFLQISSANAFAFIFGRRCVRLLSAISQIMLEIFVHHNFFNDITLLTIT